MWWFQVGSTVTLYDPSQKLKTTRATGIIIELLNGGKDARVRIKDTKSTPTIRCELVRNDGVQDDVRPMLLFRLR